MEEKIKLSENQERQKIAIFRHQINEFAACELKNSQKLKIITDQFKAKQSTKSIFDKLEFSKSSYNHFIDVETFFEKIINRLTLFPILDNFAQLLKTIRIQFSNQKWGFEYKIAEQMLKNRENISPIQNHLCLSCSENKWHQHIKSEKYHIFNLKIQDPFQLYNEPTLKPKEVNGEEIDHKKIQQKLSELAFGVQIQQKCLKELLQDLNQKEEMSYHFQEGQFQNQNISLPVMPMLRSLFHHTRGNKRICQEIGVQTIQIVEKNAKIVEHQPIFNDLQSQKEKLQCKLITQLSDKTLQIKQLEEKNILAEKTEKDLKAQHNILIQENISLQKRNSDLQVQLNISKLKQTSAKFKMANKKKSSQKTKEDISTAVNKSYNNQAHFNQQLQKALDQIVPNKIRGATMLDSKFKSQNTPNKTMFIPNLYQNQKINRQSITPLQHGSTISIERGSDKPDDEGLNSVIDFPSLRQSIHSNQAFNQIANTVKFDSNKIQKVINQKKLNKIQKSLKQELNKSKRKLKQITKKTINSQSANLKEWIRSQNPSPDQQQKNIRRVGKFQDRQSLLRMLYDSQVKECSDKSLNFDYFKKSYQNFVLKIVGINDSECETSKLSKLNHLHKKSTISIKQYFRNDVNESKEQISPTMQSANNKSSEEPKKYFRFSTCFRDIINNLFAEENQIDPANIDQIMNGKIILSNEQLKVTTQIFAYMIQLKVNNLSAYSKIRTIVSLQSGQRKKGSNFSEQNKELKLSISAIIKSHRKCQYAQGHNYCRHIQSFIKNIAVLMDK